MTDGGAIFDMGLAQRQGVDIAINDTAGRAQNIVDAIVGGNTASAVSGSGISDAAAATQGTAVTAAEAQALATAHAAESAKVNNKPIWASADTTAAVSVPLASLTGLGTNQSPTVAEGAFIVIPEAKKIGSVSTIVRLATIPCTTYVFNVYTVNLTTGTCTKIYTSGNLSAQVINNGGTNWVINILSGPAQFDVSKGDVLYVEGIFTSTGGAGRLQYPSRDFSLSGAMSLTHPTAIPSGSRGSRTVATLGASPATITGLGAAAAYATTPFFAVGVTDFGADYQPSVTTEYNTAGSHTYTIPAWMVAGDELDVVQLGGGGSGAPTNVGSAPGGSPGAWHTQTLVCGTDFVAGGSITVVVGAGGTHAGSFGAAGNAGSSTTATYTDPGATPHTLTATGGAGGAAGSFGASMTGFGADPQTFNGRVYTGSGDTYAGSSPGTPPGGGGAGGDAYQLGGNGAPGRAWITTKQV